MSRFARRAISLVTGVALATWTILPALAAPPAPDLGATVVTQSSSNTAIIVQSGSATTGAAVATDDLASAVSGDAKVELEAEQEQTAVQVAVAAGAEVDAGAATTLVATSVEQDATNWAGIEQTGVAITGDAAATDDLAFAKSGDAEVEAEAEQEQTIVQIAANAGVTIGGDETEAAAFAAQEQDADNIAFIVQDLAAVSGDAVAAGHFAFAKSGDAEAEAEAEQEQLIVQVAANIALPILGFDTSVLAAQGALQDAENFAQVEQVGLAVSGPAVATGDFADAITGDAEVELESEQEQLIVQGALNAALAILTDETAVAAISASDQIASNESLFSQTGVAVSGAAVATGDFSDAKSGDAKVELEAEAEQAAIQLLANVGFALLESEEQVESIAAIGQLKAESACIIQEGVAVTGPAAATDTFAFADSGDAKFEAEAEIEQFDLQLALVINGVLEFFGVTAQ